MYRVRMFDPHPSHGGKYDQPAKEAIRHEHPSVPPYFAPPSTFDYSKPAARKLIVEGEKKTVAVLKYLGIPACGIGGCWNWTGIHPEDGEEQTHAAHQISSPIKEWLKLPDTKLVELVFDQDVMTKEQVTKAASALWWLVTELGYECNIVLVPKGGIDDWIMSVPDGSARQLFEELPRIKGWQLPLTSAPEMFHALGITVNPKTGIPQTNERTVRRLLSRHPKYQRRLWVDLIKHACMADDEPFSDAVTFQWLNELQEFFPSLSMAVCYQTMVGIAWERPRNLIAEWAEKLVWDGTPRLASFASRYLKQADTAYSQRVFPNFLVAALARMFKPGTKFDHMLVLQGPQGIGKTRVLTALFGKDYASIAPHTTAIGSRDWLDAGGSGWCLILDELAGLSKVEHTELKTALSTERDTYRRAYRRDTETFPRMFVIAGTTNESVYLSDPTGNRRYWPVPCDVVNVAAVERDREQLWAEAYHLYREGFDFWHLPEEAEAEARQHQDAAYVPDETEEVVEATLARAFAETEAARPPVFSYMGRECYFVGTIELMAAVSGEDRAFAKNAGLGRRVRAAMTKQKQWLRAVVRAQSGVQRRGYVMACKDADAAPRTRFETSWETEFGQGSKY
jgi:hypothetical protein